MKYKLRCEFLKDATSILGRAGFINFKLGSLMTNALLDCELEFESEGSLEEVKKLILECEDDETGVELHVAIQTVQPIKSYTGERSFPEGDFRIPGLTPKIVKVFQSE